MPEEIRSRATSVLQLSGSPVSRECVLKRLIHDLDRCYGELEDFGFAPLAARWQARFGCAIGECGSNYSIKASSAWRAGSIEMARCYCKMTSGTLQRIVAGDVIPVEN